MMASLKSSVMSAKYVEGPPVVKQSEDQFTNPASIFYIFIRH